MGSIGWPWGHTLQSVTPGTALGGGGYGESVTGGERAVGPRGTPGPMRTSSRTNYPWSTFSSPMEDLDITARFELLSAGSAQQLKPRGNCNVKLIKNNIPISRVHRDL